MAATTANGNPTATTASPSSSSSTNGIQIHSEAINKIVKVPLVNAPLNFAYSTIESHQILSKPYHFGEDVVNQSLKIAEPITSRFNGQLSYLDLQAVKALEFAESKWSYPFKVTPGEVVALPKDVIATYADALQKAWNSNVQPQVNHASAKFEELKSQNAVLQQAADAIHHLQERLAKTLETIKANGSAGGEDAKGLVNGIFAEIEKVRQFGQSLPADARKRLDPILETFGNTYHRLATEVSSGGPIVPKLQKVLTYVQEEALPALRKAALEGKSAETGAAAKPKTNGAH